MAKDYRDLMDRREAVETASAKVPKTWAEAAIEQLAVQRVAQIHRVAAGAGFDGKITLEFVNLGANPIPLRVGKPIAQILFHQTLTPSERPYGSHGLNSRYQGQDAVTGSRL